MHKRSVLEAERTLYKGSVRSQGLRGAMTYGTEGWAMKVVNLWRLQTTEMRMLWMMCGKTLNDKVRSEKMREMTRVEEIGQFVIEHRLRWVKRGYERTLPVGVTLTTCKKERLGRFLRILFILLVLYYSKYNTM